MTAGRGVPARAASSDPALALQACINGAPASVPPEPALARAGRVTIGTRSQADTNRVIISITDNGPGIPPDFRTRIFEAFESTKGQGGTGLGLATAKKITDELGGEIEVKSKPDKGTSFHIKLPMTPHAT